MKNTKRGISLIVSYVLLVLIAISLSVGVYAWLKFMAGGINPIDECPEGISLIIEDYEDFDGKILQLSVKNRGRHNVDGYSIKGTDNRNQTPWFNLKDTMSLGEGVEGKYLFTVSLKPGETDTHNFSYDGLEKLEKIEVEPFRIQEKTSEPGKAIIYCDEATIIQETIEYFIFNLSLIPGLVSWWDFGGLGGIALDLVGGNNGLIYGSTALLMNFDEPAFDYNIIDHSIYNNDGIHFGNTVLMMRFDENPVYIKDSSPYETHGSPSSNNQFGVVGNWHADIEQLGAIDGFSNVGKLDSPGGCCEDVFTNQFTTGDFPVWAGSGQYLYLFVWFKGSEFPAWQWPGTWVRNPTPDSSKYQLYILKSDGQTGGEYFRIYYTATTIGYFANPVVVKEEDLPTYVPGEITGNAMTFDGLDDYIDTNNDLSWTASDRFSIGFWIKPASVTGFQGVMGKIDPEWEWSFRLNDNGLRFIYWNNVGGCGVCPPIATVTLNQWDYFVMTYDPSEGAKFYKNGDLAAIDDTIETPFQNRANSMLIGRAYTAGGENPYFNGELDEVAVYDRTLSQSEIRDNFNTKKTKFTDRVSGKSGSAIEFADPSDWLEIPGTIDIGNTWTISTWFLYPIAEADDWRTLTRGSADHQIIVKENTYDLGTYDSAESGGTGFKDSGFDMNTSSNGWHHLVVVQDGTDIIYYIDNSQVGIVAGYISTSDIYAIGNYQGGGQEWGTIDEFAIYNKSLSPEEIDEIFNAGRAKFLERIDDPERGSVLRLDGERNYIDLGNDASLNFSDGDFTYSAWIKTSAVNVNSRIISQDKDDPEHKGLIIDDTGANIDLWCRDTVGNAIIVQGTININDGEWHHVVGIREGGTGYTYVDGELDNSTTPSTAPGSCDGNANTFVGARDTATPGLFFNGSIDDVLIFNRPLSAEQILEIYEETKLP